MLKYITKEDYEKLLGVTDIPNDFNKLVIEASSYINYNTRNRIDEKNPSENVKYATCLIIELIKEQNEKISEIGNLKSQDIEGWKETYITPEEIEKDYSRKKYSILKQYLSQEIGKDGQLLLYSGVC